MLNIRLRRAVEVGRVEAVPLTTWLKLLQSPAHVKTSEDWEAEMGVDVDEDEDDDCPSL